MAKTVSIPAAGRPQAARRSMKQLRQNSVILSLRLVIAVLMISAILAARVSVGIASQDGDPVIAAAGDIACDPNDPNFKSGNGTPNGCAQLRTSKQLASDSTVDLVLGLGDMQYECDDLSDYTLSYTPSWGTFDSMMYPVAGNHEYQTGTDRFGNTCPATNTTAANYFWYFGDHADPHDNGGHFSFDLGGWHIIGLNANCSKKSVGGCGASSPETVWLNNDLGNTTKGCILAYWHQPRWTGLSSNDSSTSAWWTLLYQKHADVVLNGHVHSYQRYPKLNPSGQPDPQGIREVVAATGGESQQPLSSSARPQAEAAFKAFGYLRMVLHVSSYDAAFVKYDGTVLDSFSGTCNPIRGSITLDGSPTHGTASSGTRIGASLPKPAGGLSDGDWVGCMVSNNASSTLTPPAQYTLVPNTLQTSTTITTGVYYHIWHAGDPTSSLIFRSSVTGNLSYMCGAYRGVNQSTPFDGSGSQHNSESNVATSPAASGHAKDLLLMLYGVAGSSHTFTTASEGTIESSLSGGPAGAWIDYPLTANGSTGSQNVAVSGDANSTNGIQITLLPDGP